MTSHIRSDKTKIYHRRIAAFFVAFSSVAILWSLARSLPLTHDEAFTFIRLADSSPWAIINDYSMTWTNQVPFSILQSMIPGSWVEASLTLIRLPSVLLSVLLIVLTLDLLSWNRRSSTLFVMLLTASPLVITYLVLSRGYSLVMLLVAASVWVFKQAHLRQSLSWWSIAAGAVLLATAAWVVPTVVYLGPGLAVALWLRFSLARAIAFLTLTAVGSVAVHLSHLQQMISQAKNNPWSGPIAIRPLLRETLFVWWMPTTAIGLLVVLGTIRYIRRSSSGTNTTMRTLVETHFVASTSVLIGCVYFCLTLVAALIGLGWPFPRNALPAIWCLFMATALTIRLDRIPGVALFVSIMVSAAVGVFSIGTGLRTNNYSMFGPAMVDSVPVNIEKVHTLQASHILCSGYDSPVCLLAIPSLARNNIGVILSDALQPEIDCVLGNVAPRRPWQVRVMRGETLLGQVCH